LVTNRNKHQTEVDSAFKAAKRMLEVQQIIDDIARRGRIAPESLALHEISKLCDFVVSTWGGAEREG
jgi:hypothetical protein